jgi:hypothetical protein
MFAVLGLTVAMPELHPDESNHVLFAESSKTCSKWLWFAGLGEPLCGSTRACGGGYYQDYAVVLTSAQKHAPALEPILMLGQFGHGPTSESEASVNLTKARAHQETPYKRWIETLGGRVIAIQELAIQEQLVNSAFNRDCGNCLGAKGPNPDLAGVFLRMQIPFVIDEHKLFNLPGVCDSNVIYTDSDTFWNPTTADQLRAEMDFFASAPQVAVKYSTEQFRNQHKPFNTGVMFMNVPQWQKMWPSMLQFGVQRGFAFPSFDQGWINEYFNQHPGGRAYLNEHWNWKVYWGNDTVTAPRTVHFHGPKPGKGRWLECLASSDRSCLSWPDLAQPGQSWKSAKDYNDLLVAGFNTDNGAFAHALMQTYDKIFSSLKPEIETFAGPATYSPSDGECAKDSPDVCKGFEGGFEVQDRLSQLDHGRSRP